jgi:hypothetical protein
MKNFIFLFVLVVLLIAPAPAGSIAQSSAEWRDDLVDHMIGRWRLEGKIVGREAHHEVEAEWCSITSSSGSMKKRKMRRPLPRSAMKRFGSLATIRSASVMSRTLLDVFGGRFSETLGYGTRDGNAIHFVFEYPDGPFHTTFQWFPAKDTWQWLMTHKDKDGQWTEFGDLKLTRSPS